ncbi:hypothetical protein M0802_002317 [Mischocyttarus mexicanus]|nr:hypothetical protein M0802_002317 [Mischocyttarus mexicanus]
MDDDGRMSNCPNRSGSVERRVTFLPDNKVRQFLYCQKDIRLNSWSLVDNKKGGNGSVVREDFDERRWEERRGDETRDEKR